MITSTINGWNLVAMPATPVAPLQVDWSITDAVAESTSPFTQQSQQQQWPGAEMITGSFSMAPMPPKTGQAWYAFLMELQGTLNVFQLGDPQHTSPSGNIQGSAPLVNSAGAGTNQPGQSALVTNGWKISAQNLLLPGDALQIGMRLHWVLDPVTADSSGNATLNIWPSIREAPATATPVILRNAKGLFRLAANERGWQAHVRLTTVGLKFKEAR